jgi:hypothetical protein
MSKTRLTYVLSCAGMALAINWTSGCSAPATNDPQGTGGNNSSTAGSTGNGGSNATAGTTGSGGNASGGNTGGNASGGNPGTGGSISTAGTTGSGGSSAGTTGRGGTTGSAGTMGSAGTTGNAGRGGTTGSAGTGGSAGSTGSAGTTGAAGTGVRMDQDGVPLGKPGDTTSTSKKYINLGDMRLINNRWGSDAQGCSATQQSVAVNSDKSVGWTFSRQTCDASHGHPDFPEVEFGIAPFGTTSSLLTTPKFSSTTLLPIQLKDLQSASVNVDNFFISVSGSAPYWDNNVEFWISKNDPRTSTDAGVYAEIIMFTGFQGNRLSTTGGWPCDKSGSVTAGTTSYNLCHQSDTWSSGWRFFNFNINQGPFSSWTGKMDVKALLDFVRSKYSGFTDTMWLTRIEVGTEVDDNTSGSAKIKNLTFEVNGQNRSFEFAQ